MINTCSIEQIRIEPADKSLNSCSNPHFISLYSNIPKHFIKSWEESWTNCSCQYYQRKYIKKYMENVDALGEFETQVLIRIFNFFPPNTPFQCKTILSYQETYRLEFGFNPFKKKNI